MFRVLSLLVALVLGLGGYVYFDYTNSGRAEADGLTFTEYLASYASGVTVGGAGSARLPGKLVDMLPRAPEGWTVRPVEAGDIAAFLPQNRRSVPKDLLAHVEAVVKSASGRGVETAALTYERGDRKVIFQAVRYPDAIFTTVAESPRRAELQARSAKFSATEFMTVRGLDVQEDLLPAEVKARLFLADVGAQIHLRVLAPERMKDQDLVPFFQTLQVEAMNVSVVDKQVGLGRVPVIVLASLLDAPSRAAYVADLADRKTALSAAREAQRLRDEASLAQTPPAASTGGGLLDSLFGRAETAEEEVTDQPGEVVCTKGIGGSKRCSVVGGQD